MIPWRLRHYWHETRNLFRPFYVLGDQRDAALMEVWCTAVLREDSNAIDVGSHRGAILASLVRAAPRGHHLAIEPVPHLAQHLRQQFPMVEVHEVALSTSSGTATFHVTSEPSYSGLREYNYHTPQSVQAITVRTAALDDIVPANIPVHFIKVDVEGAEYQVFQGAERTLREWRPTIVFEHGARTANPYGTTPEMLYDLLTGFGLRLYSLNGRGPHSLKEFIQRCTPPTRPPEWNFVAKG